MRGIFHPVFRTVYKKKEAKLCLLFCAFPLLLVITSLLPANFMQLSGEAGSMSYMEFFEAIVNVQLQLTLPSIAFMYLATTCTHDEIKNGRLHLYKDIPRKKVFLCKAFSLLAWYGVYFAGTFLASVLTYYGYIIKQPYASGAFFPNRVEDVQYIVMGFLGTITTFIIGLLLVTALSLFLNNGVAIIAGTLFTLFCTIAPHLENINVLFPTGLLYSYEAIGFGKSVLYSLLVSAVYLGCIGAVGRYKIKRLEF